MTTVIWLTGKTCVGKSTWAAQQCKNGDVTRISTGSLARSLMSNSEIADSANPVTPTEVEGLVRSEIVNCLQNAKENDTFIIDSFPRSAEQVKWLVSVCERLQFDHRVVYATCAEEERNVRITNRSTGPDEERLINKRLEVEDSVFLGVLEQLILSELDFRVLDLKHGVQASAQIVGSPSTDLRVMFQEHAELNDEALAKFGLSSEFLLKACSFRDEVDPFSDSAVWLRRFLEQGSKEIEEALECLPEKWWTVDQADLRSVRVELIDVWHFLMSAVIASGMSAEDFSKLYYQKRSLNLARWRSGKYSSRKTSKDDSHLGRL